MNSKIAFAVATSALLLGSAAVAQTPQTSQTGDAPNVSGDLTSTLAVQPARGAVPAQPTTTTRSVSTGNTTTTTTVTVVPKAQPAPMPTTGAGEVTEQRAGERG
jgi:hypothetical protein